jgi:hypothetical protein
MSTKKKAGKTPPPSEYGLRKIYEKNTYNASEDIPHLTMG